jgi:hypothetical protein
MGMIYFSAVTVPQVVTRKTHSFTRNQVRLFILHPRMMFYTYVVLGVLISIALSFLTAASGLSAVLSLLVWSAFTAGCYFAAKNFLGRWHNTKRLELQARELMQDFYDTQDARKNILVYSTDTPDVYRAVFRTPTGKSDEELMLQMPMLGSALDVYRISPKDLDSNMGTVEVLFVMKNQLKADLRPEDTPVLHESASDLVSKHHFVGIARDEEGALVSIPLVTIDGTPRILVGGMSGSGKSGVPEQLGIHAMRSPHIASFVVDPKKERGHWAPYCESYASDADSAMELMKYAYQKMKWRNDRLDEIKEADPFAPREFPNMLNGIDDGLEGAYIFLFIDEIIMLINDMTPAQREEFESLLKALATTGRTGGVIIVVSSQSYRATDFPTVIKNQFSQSIFHRVSSFFEATTGGWTATDTVRPDLISGRMAEDTSDSSRGVFCMLNSDFGMAKSYHTDRVLQIRFLHDNLDVINPAKSHNYIPDASASSAVPLPPVPRKRKPKATLVTDQTNVSLSKNSSKIKDEFGREIEVSNRYSL